MGCFFPTVKVRQKWGGHIFGDSFYKLLWSPCGQAAFEMKPNLVVETFTPRSSEFNGI
jgi:hypothetical protein